MQYPIPPLNHQFFGLLLIFVMVGFLGCGGAQRASDIGPRGTLRFSGTPADAAIEVDENHVGPLEMFVEQGLLLRPGSHRVVVRADGYFPSYQIVEIVEDQVTVHQVDLRPIPK